MSVDDDFEDYEIAEDAHQADLNFMQEVRTGCDEHLSMLLRWQAVEPWRRVAIYREMDRRQKKEDAKS